MVDSARFAVAGIDAHDAAIGFLTRVPRNAHHDVLVVARLRCSRERSRSRHVRRGDRRLPLAWRDDMAIVKEVDTGGHRHALHADARPDCRSSSACVRRGLSSTDSIMDRSRASSGRVLRSTLSDDQPSSTGLSTVRGRGRRRSCSPRMIAASQVPPWQGAPVVDSWFSASSTEMTAAVAVKFPLRAFLRLSFVERAQRRAGRADRETEQSSGRAPRGCRP